MQNPYWVLTASGEVHTNEEAPGFAHDSNVMSTFPDTEDHDKNGYVKLQQYKKFIKTNEDNKHDTKYTIHNDTNDHDARDLHE